MHRHKVKLYLISEKEIEIELLEGIGKGWSSDFVGLQRLEGLQWRVAGITERVASILLTLGLGTVILGGVLAYSSNPMYRVYFRPTSETIEAALTQHRLLFEQVRTSGYLGYLGMMFKLPGTVLQYLGSAATFLAVVLSGLAGRIGEIASHRYLRARPSSEFISTSS